MYQQDKKMRKNPTQFELVDLCFDGDEPMVCILKIEIKIR